MESGPNRVNAPLGDLEPVIPRSRRNLSASGDSDNAGTKADKSHAGGALHAKEELGRGGGAHREWCSG